MAITKLMHMKEAAKGDKNKHLVNSVRYILNPEKTQDGLLVGGNCGQNTKDVIASMMSTKEYFGKTDGRQGYHFVISFPPKETNAETAYKLINDWCAEYLWNADYVFSIHDDKEHIHGHIVFNSVFTDTGLKYHYSKGDWEMHIQPVTDRLCRKYGLSPLEFDDTNKLGKSYAGWMKETQATFSERDIVRADIDMVIRDAASYDDFLGKMKQLGYKITRQGFSKKRTQDYISFKHEAFDRAQRTDSLGEAYSVPSIKRRIETKEPPAEHETAFGILEARFRTYRNSPGFIKATTIYKRMYTCARFYHLKDPYTVSNAKQLKEDTLKCDKLLKELSWLEANGISSKEAFEKYYRELMERKSAASSEKYTLKKVLDEVSPEASKKIDGFYKELGKGNDEAASDKVISAIEDLEDSLEPEGLKLVKQYGESAKLDKELWKEKKLADDIIKDAEMDDLLSL